MPSTLKEIAKLLMGSRERVLPSIQAFPSLDTKQIANELHLEARAKENGKLNLPAANSDFEDSAESDILAEIERQARKAAEDYRSQLDLYNSRIRRALISTEQRASIDAAGENALTDFKVQVIDDLNHLHNACSEVQGREQEFEAFRTAHKLVRLPNVVPPYEKKVRWLILAIFVVLESTLNGLFFAEGSETGLIGGVTQAFVLSLLNVGAAVLYARYGLPLVLHVRPIAKIVGSLATLFYTAWALGINLLIGHFRDLFIQNAGQVAATDLASRVMTSPFILADAKSMLLVMLGVGLSLVSLIDAVGLDDMYLGYGAIGRRRANAILAYADHKARCLADLTQRRGSAIEDMLSVIESIRTAEFDLRLAIEGSSRLNENYRAYLKHLADSYIKLLQQYREANIRARSTPPPSRFQSRPAPPVFLAEPPKPELPDLEKDAKAHIIERMEYFIKAINQQFEAGVLRYQTVAGLTGEGYAPHVVS